MFCVVEFQAANERDEKSVLITKILSYQGNAERRQFATNIP